jgi:hypothetical protein
MANFKDNLANKILGHATRILGEKIEYRFKGGGSKVIDSIFDNEWEQVDPDTERVISTNQPILGIRLKDLERAPKNGDEVLIIRDNLVYIVQDTREDGQGGVSLFLRLKKRKTKTNGREGLLK